MSKKPRDWTGYIVVIPDQHDLVITGQWKKERPDMWWWKCRNCTESSGVMSHTQLEKLVAKGMIAEPDGKIPSQYTSHPKESMLISSDDYEAMWYGAY